MNKFVIGILCILCFIRCTSDHRQLRDITSKMKPNSGFIDLTLNIVERSETDSTYQYILESLYQKDTVGIEVGLKKRLKAGIRNGEITNQHIANGISIQSIGEKSNRFIRTLSQLYGVETAITGISDKKLQFPCTNFSNEDINYNDGDYMFKISLSSSSVKPEIYMNFDFTNNTVSINEKDVEYRQEVLAYLSGNAIQSSLRTAMN